MGATSFNLPGQTDHVSLNPRLKTGVCACLSIRPLPPSPSSLIAPADSDDALENGRDQLGRVAIEATTPTKTQRHRATSATGVVVVATPERDGE
jgi:hypothetical protein